MHRSSQQATGDIGFPIAVEKREGPATALEFLGFEVDSQAMTVRLPAKKVKELKDLLRQWQGRKVATRRELDSLVGKLAHASQVVPPGKTFMRRMFEISRWSQPYPLDRSACRPWVVRTRATHLNH